MERSGPGVTRSIPHVSPIPGLGRRRGPRWEGLGTPEPQGLDLLTPRVGGDPLERAITGPGARTPGSYPGSAACILRRAGVPQFPHL